MRTAAAIKRGTLCNDYLANFQVQRQLSGLALILWTPRKGRIILRTKEVFMSEKRRQFTREFKLEAVRLVKQGQSVSKVATALGIRPAMVRNWKRQVEGGGAEKDVFRGHGRVTSQEEELRRLRRELAQVTEERDFLKKAAAYFAKEKS